VSAPARPLPEAPAAAPAAAPPSARPRGSRAWRQFRRRKLGMAGLVIIGLLALVATFADFIASDHPIVLRYDGKTYWFPNVVEHRQLATLDNRRLREVMAAGDWALMPLYEWGPYSMPPLVELAGNEPPQAPSASHLLGTDNTGRDTFARLVHGTRISLSIGVVAVSIYVLIGLVLGLLAGYFRGWTDVLVSRATEIMLNFPLLFLLLAIQGVLEKTSVFSTMVVIGLTRWTESCRLVRAEVLRIRELDYVQASRALGGSDLRIVLRHVLPNAIQPLFVTATFGVASAILIESALSFLGFGAPDPTASWGLLMTDGFQSILQPEARPLILLPGLAIFVTVTAFNLVGEGLRDAIDPRLKG
jgi:peptide/nickel transport system permease protein